MLSTQRQQANVPVNYELLCSASKVFSSVSTKDPISSRKQYRYATSVLFFAERVPTVKRPSLPSLIGNADLANLGLTRYSLSKLLEEGQYEKVSPGFFAAKGKLDDNEAALIAVSRKNPGATICLLSALAIHGLTDEIPSQINIAIPRGTQPVTLQRTKVTWHRFDNSTFELGRLQHPLAQGYSIGLYSPERTLVDAFRLSHLLGKDIAIQALKEWLSDSRNLPRNLLEVSARFPIAHPAIRSALEVLL